MEFVQKLPGSLTHLLYQDIKRENSELKGYKESARKIFFIALKILLIIPSILADIFYIPISFVAKKLTVSLSEMKSEREDKNREKTQRSIELLQGSVSNQNSLESLSDELVPQNSFDSQEEVAPPPTRSDFSNLIKEELNEINSHSDFSLEAATGSEGLDSSFQPPALAIPSEDASSYTGALSITNENLGDDATATVSSPVVAFESGETPTDEIVLPLELPLTPSLTTMQTYSEFHQHDPKENSLKEEVQTVRADSSLISTTTEAPEDLENGKAEQEKESLTDTLREMTSTPLISEAPIPFAKMEDFSHQDSAQQNSKEISSSVMKQQDSEGLSAECYPPQFYFYPPPPSLKPSMEMNRAYDALREEKEKTYQQMANKINQERQKEKQALAEASDGYFDPFTSALIKHTSWKNLPQKKE